MVVCIVWLCGRLVAWLCVLCGCVVAYCAFCDVMAQSKTVDHIDQAQGEFSIACIVCIA